MSATIISGRIVRDARIQELTDKVKSLSYIPQLAIVQVGNRPDSTAYINAKKAFAKKIGVEVRHIHLAENVSQAEVIDQIKLSNSDRSVQGIIVQLPLPVHIDKTSVIETIDPKKDVDGLTSVNYDKLLAGDLTGIIPATARGVRELLKYYSIDLKGKRVVVVGRSRLVGGPIAILSERAGAQVTVCHSKTLDLAAETIQADVLIVAVGKPKLIGASHIKPGVIIIDVGISKMPDESLNGDVDFEAVKDIAASITPVPGGVGPMTVFGLFENVVDACE